VISKLINYFKEVLTPEQRLKFFEAALCNGLATLFVKAWMIVVHHVWLLCFTNEVSSALEFLFLPFGGGESVRTLFSTLLIVSFVVGLIQYFFFSSVRIFFYGFLNWFVSFFPLERGYRIFVDVYIRSRSDIDPKVYFNEGWESGYRQRRFVFTILTLGGVEFYLLAVIVSFINLIFISISTALNLTEPAYTSVHRFREALRTGQMRINLLDFFPNKKLVIEALFNNKDQVSLVQPWLMLVYVIMNNFKRDDIFIQSGFYRSLERNLDYLYHKSSLKVLKNVDKDKVWCQPFPLENVPVLLSGGFLPILRKAGRDVAASAGAVAVILTGVTVKGYQDRKTLQTKGEEERKIIQTKAEEERNTIRTEAEEERKIIQFDSEMRRQELIILQQQRDDHLRAIENNKIMSNNVRAQLTAEVHKTHIQQSNAVITRPLSSNSTVQDTVKLNAPLEESWLSHVIRTVRSALDSV